jgi:hypothetical protein
MGGLGRWAKGHIATLLGGIGLVIPAASWLIKWAGDFDFVFERLQDPGWIGRMIQFLLDIPPWANLAIMIGGLFLIYFDSVRRTRALSPKRADASAGAFTVDPHIYCESHYVRGGDGRETKFYESVFYIIIGNNLPNGRSLKRVQARVQFMDPPVIAAIKDTATLETDIRNGEWAFFRIGRIVSEKLYGTMRGPAVLTNDELKTYEHNIPLGHLAFELAAPTGVWKTHLGNSSDIREPTIWPLNVIVSADEIISLPLRIKVDLSDAKKPVKLERPLENETKAQ